MSEFFKHFCLSIVAYKYYQYNSLGGVCILLFYKKTFIGIKVPVKSLLNIKTVATGLKNTSKKCFDYFNEYFNLKKYILIAQ